MLPTIDLGNDTSFCQGDTLLLDATYTGATYLWQDSSVDSTLNVTQLGTYWAQLTSNGCSKSDTVNVDYYLSPIIDLGNDTSLCEDEMLNLNVTTQNASYLWKDGTINPSFSIAQVGSYWVVITDQCTSVSDTINVTEKVCGVNFSLPNVFTPNKDGNIDLFTPIEKDGVTAVSTQIFNKWGQLMFTSEFIDIGWDGRTTAGIPVPDGTYYWIVNYTDLNKDEFVLKGYLTLTR